MTPAQKIISSIEKMKQADTRLSSKETLHVLKSLTKVSAESKLLEKAIYLILLTKKHEIQFDTLSLRENQIFQLIGSDFKSKEIASLLNISESTVATHRKNISKKLGITGKGNLKNIAYKLTQEKQYEKAKNKL